MRRGLPSLFYHLTRCRTSFRVLSQDFNSGISSPVEENSATFSHPRLNSCNKSSGLILVKRDTHQFQNNPSRNIDTLVEKPPHLSPRQRKIKEKADLEEAFESARTVEEMLKAFKDMELALDEKDLGLACLKLGLKLDEEGVDPEKCRAFGNRALKIFDSVDKVSIQVAMTLHLLGSASYSLKRFNDSLGYLNRANRILGKLEGEGYSVDDIRPVLHGVQLQLANTKTALGRREEALDNLRRCLEIKEMILEPDSRELGVANRELAEAYAAVLNFKEALPFCLKALDIHKAQLGNNSLEVAHDRRLLGVIYSGLEEHGKALEQNELSKKVLKNWGRNSDLVRAKIDAANMQIALGKYDEAIGTLKGVVQQTDRESMTRALVFITMAKALSNQEKLVDSERCLEVSCGILDKKEKVSPLEVVEAYMEVSMLYENMNEFEIAISLLKRSLAMLEKIPQEQHSEANVSVRIGMLLLLTGKVPQAIPYLESAAETLMECFGPKHFGVGYIYNNLGAAYLELDRPQSAAQMFAVAKDIMDVSLGPHHADSIGACQNLSKAYDAMGSFALAIEFQQQVIDAWESYGPSAKDELREASQFLEELKKKVCDSSSEKVTTKAFDLPIDNGTISSRSLEYDVQSSEK